MPLELVGTCYRTCQIQEIVIGAWFFLSNPELSQEISLVWGSAPIRCQLQDMRPGGINSPPEWHLSFLRNRRRFWKKSSLMVKKMVKNHFLTINDGFSQKTKTVSQKRTVPLWGDTRWDSAHQHSKFQHETSPTGWATPDYHWSAPECRVGME